MYVDFHSHILPCADHGSDGIETSLTQISHAHTANIDTIVATPHFYPQTDSLDEFLARRELAYQELSQRDLHGIKIIRAAEVLVTAGLEELDGLERLCIENTNYILLELPEEPWPFWIKESVYRVAATRRLRPICAHIDRYSSRGRGRILQMDAIRQINAASLMRGFRKRRELEWLVSRGYIHVLGSDAHGDGEQAYRNFALAMKRLGPMAEQITHNARKIITNDFI